MRRLTLLALAVSLMTIDSNATAEPPRVRLETTFGPIVVELEPERAPRSAENFLRYVREGLYDGTIFHRVIPGFMVQGGGYTRDYREATRHAPIRNESDNGLSNARGTLAMARTTDPHSATSQFFINLVDNPYLDHGAQGPGSWGYTVFGRVVEGMAVVDRIAQVPTGAGGPFPKDVPQTPVVIESARLVGGD